MGENDNLGALTNWQQPNSDNGFSYLIPDLYTGANLNVGALTNGQQFNLDNGLLDYSIPDLHKDYLGNLGSLGNGLSDLLGDIDFDKLGLALKTYNSFRGPEAKYAKAQTDLARQQLASNKRLIDNQDKSYSNWAAGMASAAAKARANTPGLAASSTPNL